MFLLLNASVRVWQVISGVGHCVQILRQRHRRLATRSSLSLEHQRPFTHVYHAEFHHCPLVYRFTTLYPSFVVTYWRTFYCRQLCFLMTLQSYLKRALYHVIDNVCTLTSFNRAKFVRLLINYCSSCNRIGPNQHFYRLLKRIQINLSEIKLSVYYE